MLWAHRGRNRIAPENTMAAFRAALNAGDRGIELDVTLSSDGFPVVIHDDTVDRTTNGSGPVSGMTYEQLRGLDAGSWFDRAFSSEYLPLLTEVLGEARGRLFVNIEIKASAWRENPKGGVEEVVMSAVRDFDMGNSVVISAFDWRSLRRIREMDPHIAIGVLADTGWDPSVVASFARDAGAMSINPDIKDVINGIPEAYRRFGGVLHPYTIKDEHTRETLERAGFQGCFADLPFSG